MRKLLPTSLLWLVFFFGLVAALDKFPPLSWDEGWTLTVAYNFVARGFYGLYLDGNPVGPGLSAAFPSVASIATAFQFFGIGLWQARFVSVMYMMGALAALYALARLLYNRRAAVLALLSLIVFASMLEMQAIVIGRKVLAEAPMLFFLLMGYLFFSRALSDNAKTRTWLALCGACLMWSLALVSKAQPLPFWALSLAAIFVYAALTRRPRAAAQVVIVFVTSLLLMRAWLWGIDIFLRGHTLPSTPLPELLNLSAFVLIPKVRVTALSRFLLEGLLLLFGLLLASWTWWREKTSAQFSHHAARLALLVFVWSWLLWYLTLSVAWERYLFSAVFVGSIFTGYLLDRFVAMLAPRQMPTARKLLRAVAIITVLVVCIFYFVLTLWRIVPQLQLGSAAADTTQWLNENVSPRARVETYDSEILFQLKPRAHFPPDTLSLEIIRKEIDPTRVLSYDAARVNADYIVVGKYSRTYEIYDSLLAKGDYIPVQKIGPYSIYQKKSVSQQ